MRGVAGTAAVLAVGSLLALGRSIVSADEAWFLQVVHRVAMGEVLYRDVFFGATPLSIDALAPFAAVWASEVWLVRAAMVVCLAATALISSRIARQLGSPREFSWLLAAALLLLAFPVPTAPYAPLATLSLLAALAACLSWEQARGRRWPLVLAGAACGACFAFKQNIGLYAVGAVVLLVLSSRARPGESARSSVTALGVIAASLVVTAAVPLVPIWWSGGLPAFVDYALLNKGTYLRLAGVSYLEGLRSSFGPVAWCAYLLPPLAWAGLATTWRHGSGPDRRRVVVVAAFCAAATLGIFPRADEVHVAYMMPVFLLALAFAWDRLGLGRYPWGRLAHAGAGIVMLALLAFRVSGPLRGVAAGTASFSSLHHFRGVVVPTAALRTIRVRSERLRENGGERTFIFSSEAGFLYLASGLRNPTPFDYPLVTALGRQGDAQVVAAIRSGAISRVCVDRKVLSRPLRPPLLSAFVEKEMALIGDAGFCGMYRPRL